MPEGESQGSERLKLFSEVPQLMPGGMAGPLIRKLCFFRDSPTSPVDWVLGEKKKPMREQEQTPMNSSRGHMYGDWEISGRRQPHRLLISEQLSIAPWCRDRGGTCHCALWKGTALTWVFGRSMPYGCFFPGAEGWREGHRVGRIV